MTSETARLQVIEGRGPVAYRADDPAAERLAWEAIKASRQPTSSGTL